MLDLYAGRSIFPPIKFGRVHAAMSHCPCFNGNELVYLSLQVEYLPVIYPTLAETKNPWQFAERVRITMARALNRSVTQHTYEDAAMAMEAVKMNIDSGAALLEFGKFEKLCSINVKDGKRLLCKFLAIDSLKRSF